MKLYSRDLIAEGLTADEKRQLSEAEQNAKTPLEPFSSPIPYWTLPQTCMHSRELFPNNCLYGEMI